MLRIFGPMRAIAQGAELLYRHLILSYYETIEVNRIGFR